MPLWIILILTFIALDILFIVIIFLKRSSRSKLTNQQLNYIHLHWIRIIDTAASNPSSSILDADKLLHYVLAIKGFQGSTGAKMKGAQRHFSDLNGIWRAHKLRNRVAHEMLDLNRAQTKKALRSFKRALNDFGANL
ncbi:hypothetical protein GF354_05430 [Candidatus Peregrinibacteria bacterium]|nr:hypothetical protein [Candidatus Peregrinibacteria bacterium]